MTKEKYIDSNYFASHRKCLKYIEHIHGKITCVRLSVECKDSTRNEAFNWCQSVLCYWTTDSEYRRFYFTESSEAVRFKLTWGGALT